MKKLVIILVLMLAFAISICAEVSQEPQKFSVTYTIKYNSLTLEEAAEKEILIKQRNKGACEIDVEVKEGSFNGNITITTTPINTSPQRLPRKSLMANSATVITGNDPPCRSIRSNNTENLGTKKTIRTVVIKNPAPARKTG